MDKIIREYRKKYKKCKWCKYYKWNSLQECHWITCYGFCKLKDKIINFDSIYRLCKYYSLKEDTNEIPTNKTYES